MKDLPALIGLQEATWLEMGRHLIASEMRKNLVKYITENDLKVGFMIDESTTISKK
jgi:hypothetical protein